VATKDYEAAQGPLQTGYRFSNQFNNVLEIPAYSEISLHSAQFSLSAESYLDFRVTGGGSSTAVPQLRVLYDRDVNFLSNNNDLEIIQAQKYPIYPSHFPMVVYPERKKYVDIEETWQSIATNLNLLPNYQQWGTYNAGALLSGFTPSVTSAGGIESVTMDFLRRRAAASVHAINSFSLIPEGPIAEEFLTLDALGVEYIDTIRRSGFPRIGTANYSLIPSYVTNCYGVAVSGIINSVTGGEVSVGALNVVPGSNAGTTAFRPSKHVFGYGIKRYEAADAIGGFSALNNWKNAGTAATVGERYETLSAFPLGLGNGMSPDAAYAYLFTRNLIEVLKIPENVVADFFFLVTGKVKSVNVAKVVTATTSEPVIHIMKYENGVQSNVLDSGGKLICIATGDDKVSDAFNIPYSGFLDPNNALYPAEPGLVGWEVSPGAPTGPGLKICLKGNEVTFFVNDGSISGAGITDAGIFAAGDVVTIARSKAVWDAAGGAPGPTVVELNECISDACLPLQVWSAINGFKYDAPAPAVTGDSDELSLCRCINTTLEGTQQTLDFANNQDYAGYNKAIAAGEMIPNSTFNQEFLDQTPWSYYPLRDIAIGVTGPEHFNVYATDPIAMNGEVTIDNFLVLGKNSITDTHLLNSRKSAPNLSKKLLYPNTVPTNVWVIEDGPYATDYSDIGGNIFTKGLYVMLKNLGNVSTMGSLNQANTSKLVGFINRYDDTQGGIFTWNSYEHLYVSLNNPTTIQTSTLSLEIIQKFGEMASTIDTTVLMFYVRPASYGSWLRSQPTLPTLPFPSANPSNGEWDRHPQNMILKPMI
tara:strand:+ start:2999 stop:5443 length:2445 start_codon:yes stop_codon:yes gene_type:complete